MVKNSLKYKKIIHQIRTKILIEDKTKRCRFASCCLKTALIFQCNTIVK